AGRLCRRPALAHGLWLLVLLKLLTPPLVEVRFRPASPAAPAAPAAAPEPRAQAPAAPEVVLSVAVPPVAAAAPPQAAPAPPPAAEPAAKPRPPHEAAPAGPAALATLAALWLAGTLAWCGLALSRVRRFRRLLDFAEPAPSWLREEVDGLAARLGLRRGPGVWLVPGRLSPMLWSLGGAPRLLLPAELLEGLTREQRATLLLHELAHLRRRDHWVR